MRQLLSDNLNAKRQLEFFDWTDGWIKQQMLELRKASAIAGLVL